MIKLFSLIKDFIWPNRKPKVSDYTYGIVAQPIMYSPRLKSFFKVDCFENGSKIVSRLYGKCEPGDFVMMLKYNEPVFVCDYTGPLTEAELHLIRLLHES